MSLREPLPPLRVYDEALGRSVLNPAIKAIVNEQFAAVTASVKRQRDEMRANFVRVEAQEAGDAV